MRKYLFISILLVSCSQTETQNTIKTYFDLVGLVNHQIEILNKTQPLTHKNLLIGEKKETLNATKIDWQKELELFLQADINKQSYQLSYNKTETPNTLIYELKKGENLPVKTLKIIFDKDKSPQRIDALMQTNNYLYQSEKTLSMDFDKSQLKSYHIEGWQELFIGSKKGFEVTGILAYKK
jgi:hypothetical protein